MQQQKNKWHSSVRELPVVAGLIMGIAIVSTWGLLGAGQTVQQAPQRPASTATPQVTPYPAWADGTQPDHMVPGKPWESAYQPDGWPSQRQLSYVKQIQQYHPALYAQWGKRLNQALTNKKLDRRTEMLIAAATASMVFWARPVVEYYIDLAFEAGSNTKEIMAALNGGSEPTEHSLHDGLGALWHVVHTRQKAGKPTPLEGPPLTEKDLIPGQDWTPVKLSYQLPHPRPHDLSRWKYDPVGEEIERRENAERRKLQLRQHMPVRLIELIWTASDMAVVRWPHPLLDNHLNQGLSRGSNLQEFVEVMMVAAELVQGAADSNVAGRRVPTGPEILVHGLQGLSRVVAERDKAGFKSPAEYGEGFTKKMY